MPIILDGKKAREALKSQLIERIQKSPSTVPPCLAIVQIGNRADSAAYISSKKKFAAEIGVTIQHIQLPETTGQEELMKIIDRLNIDPAVHGIIAQLPFPAALDKETILNAILVTKDIDGLSSENVKKWSAGQHDAIWPATTRGISELLHFYDISLKGKKVAMIGRSFLVGKPTAAMCIAEGAEVTICHRQTLDLPAETRKADIIIVAAGSPRLIGPQHVRPGQVIVDVGTTNNFATMKLEGDVDFDAVAPILGDKGAITPVPGGVGQMTVLALFENCIDAYDGGAADVL